MEDWGKQGCCWDGSGLPGQVWNLEVRAEIEVISLDRGARRSACGGRVGAVSRDMEVMWEGRSGPAGVFMPRLNTQTLLD